jgi:tubulin polyglutamylase TTLL9
VAIQKKSAHYNRNRGGGKWDLRNLKLFLISKHGEAKVNKCFSDIQKLIIHTYKSVQKVIINDKHCFELYGLDVMLDDNLKPWLLETNASPSLTASTDDDRVMKLGLLDDTLTTIDVEKV